MTGQEGAQSKRRRERDSDEIHGFLQKLFRLLAIEGIKKGTWNRILGINHARNNVGCFSIMPDMHTLLIVILQDNILPCTVLFCMPSHIFMEDKHHDTRLME